MANNSITINVMLNAMEWDFLFILREHETKTIAFTSPLSCSKCMPIRSFQ